MLCQPGSIQRTAITQLVEEGKCKEFLASGRWFTTERIRTLSSDPQPFLHQGPDSWKTIFLQPRMAEVGSGYTSSSSGAMVQVVMQVMRNAGRLSFDHLPAVHLCLCGWVPDKPWTSTSPYQFTITCYLCSFRN